jgi:hypothetical protein
MDGGVKIDPSRRRIESDSGVSELTKGAGSLLKRWILPTGGLVVNEPGSGHPQYPPAIMLALLIYCYANGIFASRRIERATFRDLGVRFLPGDTHPDYDTVCTFRRENLKLITKFFVRVLELASKGRHHRAAVLVAMEQKLRSPEGRARYLRRQASVEPVFGIIKKVLAFEQFSLRGLRKVTLEWNLVCTAYNLKRLHKLVERAEQKPKMQKLANQSRGLLVNCWADSSAASVLLFNELLRAVEL